MLKEQALFRVYEIWDRYDFLKSFVSLIWDTKKNKLYGDQDGETSGCSCPLTGDLTSSACLCRCVANGVTLRQRHEYIIVIIIKFSFYRYSPLTFSIS